MAFGENESEISVLEAHFKSLKDKPFSERLSELTALKKAYANLGDSFAPIQERIAREIQRAGGAEKQFKEKEVVEKSLKEIHEALVKQGALVAARKKELKEKKTNELFVASPLEEETRYPLRVRDSLRSVFKKGLYAIFPYDVHGEKRYIGVGDRGRAEVVDANGELLDDDPLSKAIRASHNDREIVSGVFIRLVRGEKRFMVFSQTEGSYSTSKELVFKEDGTPIRIDPLANDFHENALDDGRSARGVIEYELDGQKRYVLVTWPLTFAFLEDGTMVYGVFSDQVYVYKKEEDPLAMAIDKVFRVHMKYSAYTEEVNGKKRIVVSGEDGIFEFRLNEAVAALSAEVEGLEKEEKLLEQEKASQERLLAEKNSELLRVLEPDAAMKNSVEEGGLEAYLKLLNNKPLAERLEKLMQLKETYDALGDSFKEVSARISADIEKVKEELSKAPAENKTAGYIERLKKAEAERDRVKAELEAGRQKAGGDKLLGGTNISFGHSAVPDLTEKLTELFSSPDGTIVIKHTFFANASVFYQSKDGKEWSFVNFEDIKDSLQRVEEIKPLTFQIVDGRIAYVYKQKVPGEDIWQVPREDILLAVGWHQGAQNLARELLEGHFKDFWELADGVLLAEDKDHRWTIWQREDEAISSWKVAYELAMEGGIGCVARLPDGRVFIQSFSPEQHQNSDASVWKLLEPAKRSDDITLLEGNLSRLESQIARLEEILRVEEEAAKVRAELENAKNKALPQNPVYGPGYRVPDTDVSAQLAAAISAAHEGKKIRFLFAYDNAHGEKRYVSVGDGGKAFAFKEDGTEDSDDPLAEGIRDAHKNQDIHYVFSYEDQGEKIYISVGNKGKAFAFKKDGTLLVKNWLAAQIREAHQGSDIFFVFSYETQYQSRPEKRFLSMGRDGKAFVFKEDGVRVEDDPLAQAMVEAYMGFNICFMFSYKVQGEKRYMAVGASNRVFKEDGTPVLDDSLQKAMTAANGGNGADFVLAYEMQGTRRYLGFGDHGRVFAFEANGTPAEDDELAASIRTAYNEKMWSMVNSVLSYDVDGKKRYISVGIDGKAFAFGQDTSSSRQHLEEKIAALEEKKAELVHSLSVDPAQKSKDLGGIDLNPDHLSMTTSGNRDSSVLSSGNMDVFLKDNFPGLIPVILDISPAPLPDFASLR
ncbi:MAG: hypothetical protein HQL16_05470 [Candidatus Omnitrophica bacterium]|nr:hypothetical protein [Candidatus Omnitrophota bacterium]